MRRNGIATHEIVAAFFTMTPDLNANFPAYAARDMGWSDVSMLGAQESLVPGGLERTIRVLLLAAGGGPTRHVYLGRAASMRPDLAEPGDSEAWDGNPAGEGPSAAVEGRFGRLLVVGLGLIGGSLAAAARAHGSFNTVAGYDRDPRSVSVAVRRRLIDDAAVDLDEELARADMVVLAVPVREIVDLVGYAGERVKPGCVLTDVGSTKATIVDAMNRLSGRARAVGGHPMAGGTRSGSEAARADLFTGARWALVETRSSDEASMERVERLVRALGARPLRMGAEAHDRLVAATSHLPALVSVALVRHVSAMWGGGGNAAALIGPGFVGASRLAAGDPGMTAQMLTSNSSNLTASVDALIAILRELAAEADSDSGRLAELLSDAHAARASLVEEFVEDTAPTAS